jgi:hypothetical protein
MRIRIIIGFIVLLLLWSWIFIVVVSLNPTKLLFRGGDEEGGAKEGLFTNVT